MQRGLVLAALLAAAPALAQQAQQARKTRVAVLDVQYAGVGDRKTVEGLSALLASEVARRPGLTVIAGGDLRALLGYEQQKQLLGCADGACITELAGALGADFLVTSEASRVGKTWLLSLALLDAKKATAVNRLTRRAYTDDALVDESSRAVDELLAAMPGPLSGPARPAAPPATPAPAAVAGEHVHDGGFFRLQLGGGVLSSSASGASAGGTGTSEVKLSGTSFHLGLAVGYAVATDLIVSGELLFLGDSKPKVTYNGQSVRTSNVSHALTGLGLGLTYYLSAINAYAEVMAGVGQASLDVNGTSYSTNNGPVFRVGVGKEWWVSTNWGIGLGVNGIYGSMKDQGTDAPTWKSTAFSLDLSATYN